MRHYTITIYKPTGEIFSQRTIQERRSGLLFLPEQTYAAPERLEQGLTAYSANDLLKVSHKGDNVVFEIVNYSSEKGKRLKVATTEFDDLDRVITFYNGYFVAINIELETVTEIKRNLSEIEKKKAEIEKAEKDYKLLKLALFALIAFAIALNAELFLGLAVILIAIIGGLR